MDDNLFQTQLDGWFQREQERRAARTATGTLFGTPEPDAVAEGLALGDKLGVPAAAVLGAPEVFRNQAAQADATEALANAPRTRAWLADPLNGGLARDDLANLSWFERVVQGMIPAGARGPITNAARRTAVRTQAIPSTRSAFVAADTLADVGRSVDDLYAEEVQKLGPNPSPELLASARDIAQWRFETTQGMGPEDVSRLLQEGARAAMRSSDLRERAAAIPMSETASRFRDALPGDDAPLMDTIRAFGADPIGGAAFVSETAAEMIPLLLTAAGATVATRNPLAGAAVMGGGSFALEASESAMAFLEEQGVDLSTPEAAAAVIMDGDLMRAARDRGLGRGVIIAAFDALSGGVAGHQLARSPAADWLAQAFAQGGLAGGGEAAAGAATGTFSWRDAFLEALADVAHLPAEVIGVGGRGLIRRFGSYQQAGDTARRLQEIDQMAAESLIRQRSPDAFEGALEAQGLGEAPIFVPATDLREFFQAKDLAFEDALTAWGLDPLAFEEAEAAGGMVSVAASTYAARISGTEDAAWLQEHGTFDPEGMSAAQARTFNEEVRSVMEEAYERAQAEAESERAMRAADVQIEDEVFRQLRAAGRSPDVAQAEARVWGAFWWTMGERYGEDPLDLAQTMPVTIRGPQTEEAVRRRGQADIGLNRLRAQGSKALAPRGPSLLEWVRSMGGVRDEGGDVESMGPPKGVIAETRAEAQARRSQASLDGVPSGGKGRGLDELGRAAIEAGFFEGVSTTNPDGTVVDEAALLLEAIGEEIAGRPRYRPGDEPDPDMTALAEELSRRGIDLAEVDNDAAVAALERDEQGREYGQDGRLLTDTPEFRAWFGDSKVVDADGKPLVVYHGTMADVEAFDPAKRGEATGAYSATQGFFFARSPDVAGSYAAGFNMYQDTAVGRVVNKLTGGLYEKANEKVIGLFGKSLVEPDGVVMPVYLSIQNPLAVDQGGAAYRDESYGDIITRARGAGHDGVIIRNTRDEGFRGGDDITDVFVAFEPTQIKSVFNRGTFSISDPRILLQDRAGKRGSIVLPAGGVTEGKTVINLFESADLSTLLHESGHYFLEAFASLTASENAPEAMRADMAAIRDWLGAKEGELFTTEQHEKWARGFEAYALEGKAPSLALADAFARFKAWLTRIYRSLAGLNVKLSPEIREVMDRMLATDAEIAAARDEMAMHPLFKDAPPGMAAGDWNAYQRLARRSKEEAERALLERTMAKVRREREAWFRAERKAVREEVEAEVNKRREHRLVEMLANGRWLGREGEVPDLQISRKALVEQFGEGVLAEVSRTRLGGKRAIYGDGEGAMSPQEAAEFFGFRDAVEMVTVLQNTGKRMETIAQETERRLTERHGDPLNDGSIEEEALQAIHNEQQAQTAVAEARHIAARLGRSTKTMQVTLYRQRARLMLGQMRVRDVMRPGAFLEAERKAARAAQDAFAKVLRGDDKALAAALQAKEQQVLNAFLYDEARGLEKQIERMREKARSYDRKAVRAKLAGGYIEQIDALLEDYDFRRRGEKAVARMESLKAFVDRMIAEGREAELAIDDRLLGQARRVHYSRLSVDELRGLFDTIDNLDHLGRFKQKLIEKARQRDLDATVSEVEAAMDANLRDNPPARFETRGERRKTRMRQILDWVLNADTLLREIDGFADLGPAWRGIKQGIDEGLARLTERRMAAGAGLDALYSVYSAKERRAMSVKKANPALGGEMASKWDLIAMALNTGNADNWQRLTNPETPGGFTSDQVRAALALLDERDWRFVQSWWDHINGYWPEIAAKQKRQTGVEPKKVEANLMVEAPAFVTGGYYPIKYDSRHASRVTETESKELMDQMRAGRFGKAQTRNGHTKERVSSTKLPLKLDLSVAHEHVANVLYDIELGEAVNASWRVLMNARIRDGMRRKGKAVDHEALEIWLQDVASGDRVMAYGMETVMRHLRSGFTISRLAFNISTALIQPSGLAQSAVVVGKKALAAGTLEYLRHPQRWAQDVAAVSPMMRERQATFERDIYTAMGDIQEGPAASWAGQAAKFHRDVVLPLSFVMMQKVQFYAVDLPTWVAAYQKARGEGQAEDAARLYADTMVKRAQGSGLMADRGMLERGTTARDSRQRELPRLLTALGSYMFAKGNVAYELTRGTNFRSPVDVMSWAVDMALLFTFEAVLYAAVKGQLPGEDEDEPEEIAAWLAKETALSIMGTMPLLRDAASAAEGFGGGGVTGAVIEAVARPLIQAGQGEADLALVRSLVDATGIFLHLPSSQTNAILKGFLDDDLSVRRDIAPGAPLGLGAGQGRSMADLIFGE